MNADLISPGLRALIVEDEALIAEELRDRLSQLGFRVIGTVDCAEEGIALATKERPDLVLMDIRLRGEKDGIEACQEIQREMDVAILYVTAYSDRQTVERAQQTDHDGFILKPFHRHELQSTIAVALQRHVLRRTETQDDSSES